MLSLPPPKHRFLIVRINDLPERWQDVLGTMEALRRMGFADSDITPTTTGGGGDPLRFGIQVRTQGHEFIAAVFSESRGVLTDVEREMQTAFEAWNRAVEFDKKWLWRSFRHRIGDSFMPRLAEALTKRGIEPPNLREVEG